MFIALNGTRLLLIPTADGYDGTVVVFVGNVAGEGDGGGAFFVVCATDDVSVTSLDVFEPSVEEE